MCLGHDTSAASDHKEYQVHTEESREREKQGAGSERPTQTERTGEIVRGGQTNQEKKKVKLKHIENQLTQYTQRHNIFRLTDTTEKEQREIGRAHV